MSMISWPFDSTVTEDAYGNPTYSNAYSSDVLARILRKYFQDGVFSTEDDCLQVLEASDMTVSINPGDCLIQGRHGYLEAAETLTIDTADESLDRIDLVVLRLDLSVSGLSITPAVVTGTAAASPSAPTVTRNSTIYELALAELYIGAAVTAITQSVITDTRLDTDRCGVVASILGDTDTSTYYAQIAADLAEFKTGREADFDTWFEGIENSIDETTAGTLVSVLQAISADGLLKGDGAGGVTAAVAGTDYAGIDSNGKVDAELTSAHMGYYTEAFTLALSHAGMLLRVASTSSVAVTIPPSTSVDFPVGTEIEICRYGSGAVTIVAGTGVTIRSLDSMTAIAGQYTCVCLKSVAADYWLLTGALE